MSTIALCQYHETSILAQCDAKKLIIKNLVSNKIIFTDLNCHHSIDIAFSSDHAHLLVLTSQAVHIYEQPIDKQQYNYVHEWSLSHLINLPEEEQTQTNSTVTSKSMIRWIDNNSICLCLQSRIEIWRRAGHHGYVMPTTLRKIMSMNEFSSTTPTTPIMLKQRKTAADNMFTQGLLSYKRRRSTLLHSWVCTWMRVHEEGDIFENIAFSLDGQHMTAVTLPTLPTCSKNKQQRKLRLWKSTASNERDRTRQQHGYEEEDESILGTTLFDAISCMAWKVDGSLAVRADNESNNVVVIYTKQENGRFHSEQWNMPDGARVLSAQWLPENREESNSKENQNRESKSKNENYNQVQEKQMEVSVPMTWTNYSGQTTKESKHSLYLLVQMSDKQPNQNMSLWLYSLNKSNDNTFRLHHRYCIEQCVSLIKKATCIITARRELYVALVSQASLELNTLFRQNIDHNGNTNNTNYTNTNNTNTNNTNTNNTNTNNTNTNNTDLKGFIDLVGSGGRKSTRFDHPSILLQCLLLDNTKYMKRSKDELQTRMEHTILTFEIATKKKRGSLTYRPFLTHGIRNEEDLTWWMRTSPPPTSSTSSMSTTSTTTRTFTETAKEYMQVINSNDDVLNMRLISSEKRMIACVLKVLSLEICNVEIIEKEKEKKTKMQPNASSNTASALFTNRSSGRATASALFANRGSNSAAPKHHTASSLFANRRNTSTTTTTTPTPSTPSNSSLSLTFSKRTAKVIWLLHTTLQSFIPTDENNPQVQLDWSFSLVLMLTMNLKERCELFLQLMETNHWKWSIFRDLHASTWMIVEKDNEKSLVVQTLEKTLERVAQETYKKTKDPNDVLLHYVVLNKLTLLSAMYRAKHRPKVFEFLDGVIRSRATTTTFDTTTKEDASKSNKISARNRQATKNAAMLMKRGSATMAAAFFLLTEPPRIREAINVLCSRSNDQGGDADLGTVIACIYDARERKGEGQGEGKGAGRSTTTSHVAYVRNRWFPLESNIKNHVTNDDGLDTGPSSLSYSSVAKLWSSGKTTDAKLLLQKLGEQLLSTTSNPDPCWMVEESMYSQDSNHLFRLVRLSVLPSLLDATNDTELSTKVALQLRTWMASTGAYDAALLSTTTSGKKSNDNGANKKIKIEWGAHLLLTDAVLPDTIEGYRNVSRTYQTNTNTGDASQLRRETRIYRFERLLKHMNILYNTRDEETIQIIERALNIVQHENNMLSYRYDLRCDLAELCGTIRERSVVANGANSVNGVNGVNGVGSSHVQVSAEFSVPNVVEEIMNKTLSMCALLRNCAKNNNDFCSTTALRLLTMSICADDVGRRILQGERNGHAMNNLHATVFQCSRIGIFTALLFLPRFALISMFFNLHQNARDDGKDEDAAKEESNYVGLDDGMRSVLMEVVVCSVSGIDDGISCSEMPGRNLNVTLSETNVQIHLLILIGAAVQKYILLEKYILVPEVPSEKETMKSNKLLNEHLIPWSQLISGRLLMCLNLEIMRPRPFEEQNPNGDDNKEQDHNQNNQNKYTQFEARVIFRKMAHALMSMNGQGKSNNNMDDMLDISHDNNTDNNQRNSISSPSRGSRGSPSTSSSKSKLSKVRNFLGKNKKRSQSKDDLFNTEDINEEEDHQQHNRSSLSFLTRHKSVSVSSSSNGYNLPVFNKTKAMNWLIKYKYVKDNNQVDSLLLQMEDMSLIKFTNRDSFMPCRPRRVILCDPRLAQQARIDADQKNNMLSSSSTSSSTSSYKVWKSLNPTTKTTAIASLMGMDPVPHVSTKIIQGLGPTASELWEMLHASSYLLAIISKTSPKDMSKIYLEKNITNNKTHPGFVCAAIQSGLLSRFGYLDLRVVWEVEIQILNVQYENSAIQHSDVHGAVWLSSKNTKESQEESNVTHPDNGIDRRLLRQHGGGLISHLDNIEYNSHHLFQVPVTSSLTYRDALFWGRGGDIGANVNLNWFHLLPPPPPSTLNITLYNEESYLGHTSTNVLLSSLSTSDPTNNNIHRVCLVKETQKDDGSSTMVTTGSLELEIKQQVNIVSGTAPTRKIGAGSGAGSDTDSLQHVSRSNPGLIRCVYSQGDVSMGLELKRFPMGGCLIVSVVEGSVSDQAGLSKGMSLIKVGNHRGGKDVTNLDFNKILELLKKRPQKTYWQKPSAAWMKKYSTE